MNELQKNSLPGANRALVLLLLINLFNYIDRSILFAVAPEIRKAFFAADPEHARGVTGLLVPAFLFSYMLMSPVFGWLADRTRRWLLIAIGVALWSLASGASGLAATFSLLFVTRMFVGIGEAAYGPVAPTIISDLYPQRIRGRVMSLFYMAIPVGSAIGYAFGGVVNKHLGWRWPFYLVMPPGLLLAVLCFVMREPKRGASDGDGSTPHRAKRDDYLRMIKTPSYVLNTLAMTAMTFAIGGMAAWVPDYIAEYRGQGDLERVNVIFGAITVVAGLFSTLLGGMLGDKLTSRFPGAYFLVSGIAMALAFPFTVAMLYTPFPAAWVFIFLAVFCLFFNTGPSNTALANVTHPSVRASAFALNIFIIHAAGDAFSPPLIGAIADRSNMNVAFLVVSGVMLIGAAFWLFGAKFLQRDTQRAAES